MMLLKVSSLLILLSIVSCAKIPPVTSCLYDEPRQTFHCISASGNAFEMMAIDPMTDKLVCIPFNDFGIVLNYCNGLKKP